MKKVYHLSTCSTCQRIINSVNFPANTIFQDIKSEPITLEQIEQMKSMSGSYEALFSRRAMKYRSLGLNEMDLNESDYKNYILKEYTFLKRPVVILDQEIFIGNSKKTVDAIISALN